VAETLAAMALALGMALAMAMAVAMSLALGMALAMAMAMAMAMALAMGMALALALALAMAMAMGMALALALAMVMVMALGMAMGNDLRAHRCQHILNTGEIMKYVIARTENAGVFAGWLESRNGQEVVLQSARRLWYWQGAASLSQLAMEGTSCPENCKFPIAVNRVELLTVIEILDCTPMAQTSILAVPIWKA